MESTLTCALALHKIASMSSDEADTQTWIDRGTEAYWRLQISEAAQAFEKAVAIDPQSTQARLCFGVACFFLYQNGLSDAQTSFESEMTAELDRIRGLITEQNSTNGKRAEENLQQALHLEPQNKLAMAYLAALYHAWSDSTDPWGNKRRSRLTEAQHWYRRLLEIDPQHKFANYICGVIDWEKGFELLRSSGNYPRPLTNEEAADRFMRKSLRW